MEIGYYFVSYIISHNGTHIINIHASDLIQEAANAIAKRESVQNLSFNIHTHPTLSEVLDEAYKRAQVVGV